MGADSTIVTVEEAKVVVVGGHIADGGHNKGVTTVEIFTLTTKTWEYGGETFSESTGTWKKGRMYVVNASWAFTSTILTYLGL